MLLTFTTLVDVTIIFVAENNFYNVGRDFVKLSSEYLTWIFIFLSYIFSNISEIAFKYPILK